MNSDWIITIYYEGRPRCQCGFDDLLYYLHKRVTLPVRERPSRKRELVGVGVVVRHSNERGAHSKQ